MNKWQKVARIPSWFFEKKEERCKKNPFFEIISENNKNTKNIRYKKSTKLFTKKYL